MSTTGFLGLPSDVQEIVLQGLDEEVRAARQAISAAEQSRPVDPALVKSLKGDVAHAEALQSRLTGGQV